MDVLEYKKLLENCQVGYEEFPDCCGAKVICGFNHDYPTGALGRVGDYPEENVMKVDLWKLHETEKEVRDGFNGLACIILNLYQSSVYERYLLANGWIKDTPDGISGQHGYPIFLYHKYMKDEKGKKIDLKPYLDEEPPEVPKNLLMRKEFDWDTGEYIYVYSTPQA